MSNIDTAEITRFLLPSELEVVLKVAQITGHTYIELKDGEACAAIVGLIASANIESDKTKKTEWQDVDVSHADTNAPERFIKHGGRVIVASQVLFDAVDRTRHDRT